MGRERFAAACDGFRLTILLETRSVWRSSCSLERGLMEWGESVKAPTVKEDAFLGVFSHSSCSCTYVDEPSQKTR